ncbi:Uncharacterised protein [Mycobacteroides abscessus subsp. abscessus]|nr:Uncharacterised protein [Mycobacteroides abscessus subsp. abscessus]
MFSPHENASSDKSCIRCAPTLSPVRDANAEAALSVNPTVLPSPPTNSDSASSASEAIRRMVSPNKMTPCVAVLKNPMTSGWWAWTHTASEPRPSLTNANRLDANGSSAAAVLFLKICHFCSKSSVSAAVSLIEAPVESSADCNVCKSSAPDLMASKNCTPPLAPKILLVRFSASASRPASVNALIWETVCRNASGPVTPCVLARVPRLLVSAMTALSASNPRSSNMPMSAADWPKVNPNWRSCGPPLVTVDNSSLMGIPVRCQAPNNESRVATWSLPSTPKDRNARPSPRTSTASPVSLPRLATDFDTASSVGPVRCRSRLTSPTTLPSSANGSGTERPRFFTDTSSASSAPPLAPVVICSWSKVSSNCAPRSYNSRPSLIAPAAAAAIPAPTAVPKAAAASEALPANPS